MILLPFASGRTYGVVGLGKSGRATVASLLASGAQVLAWDDAEAGRDAAAKEFSELVIKPVAQWDFSALVSLVLSPGIFLNHPAVLAAKKAGIEVIGDIELLYRAQPEANYVCITGTNGKSTTTTLIAHILKACGKRVEVGGNLGTPALALAPLCGESREACHPRESGDPAKNWIPDEASQPNSKKNLGEANSGMTHEEAGIYVLELSSYQLDLVNTTRFNVAVLLNISPDHLDHHGSMENYIAAKRHIFDRMTEEDVAIVGVDDATSEAICREMLNTTDQLIIPIAAAGTVTYGIYAAAGKLHNTLADAEMVGDISAVKSLRGEHNWQNAAAAYAACLVNGCTHADILRAMASYPGLAHRMEWLGEIGGVQYVNDSKATNADAAEKALKTYENIYWIIGGVAKEGGIAPLAKYFPKIRHAYLIGEAADGFAKTLDGQVAYTHCGTLDKAFYAAQNAAANDNATKPVVLLSPACASFDQYPNFEVRGAAFVKLFEASKAGGTHGTPAA